MGPVRHLKGLGRQTIITIPIIERIQSEEGFNIKGRFQKNY
jgi:hypothetical protein